MYINYFVFQDMDETSDEEEAVSSSTHLHGRPWTQSMGLTGVGSMLGASVMGLSGPPAAVATADYNQDMSVSTLHLYDLHLSQVTQCYLPFLLCGFLPSMFLLRSTRK